METGSQNDLVEQLIKLEFAFTSKPIVFGGMAMEHYGLRKRGHDIDLFISFEDYDALAALYPECRKDSWGDFGLVVGEFELWRSIWKLDYSFFAQDAVEYDAYFVLSIEKLLLTKVLALRSPAKQKQEADIELIVQYILKQNQRPDILAFMNKHVASYLASPEGFVYNGRY